MRKGNNWEIVKLKEIAVIIMGQSPKSEFYNTNREGLPFFQGCSEFGELNPVPKKWCTKLLKIAYKDDVLMSVRAPVGDLNIADRKCIIGRGLCAMRTKINSGRFLYYLLQGNIMEITTLGSGSVYDAINKSAIENLKIEIPPLETQRKIAAVLSAYDDLIENNSRRILILEAMAQTIYKEWFVKFRFPGHEKVKMVDSELGEIPEGWEVKRLGDVVELAYGKALKKDDRRNGSFPVYGSGGVVGAHDEYLVQGPGIIVGRKGNVGSVFWSQKSFYPIDTVFFVKTNVSLYYVYYNLKEQNFVNTDAAVPGLSRNQAYLNKFLLPPNEILHLFAKFIFPIFSQIEILHAKIENLRRTRDFLLPKLIGGEMEVLDINIEQIQGEKIND
jgi:type I restriction enzyme S subunit